MNEDIYILGVGRNTSVYIDLAEACGYRVAGLYHYNEELKGSCLHGYQIVGVTEDLLKKKSLTGMNFSLSMGDNLLRHKIADIIRSKGGLTPTLISPKAYISKFVNLETGVVVHANSSVQADVCIRKDSVISFNVDVAHNCTIGKACFIAGGTVLGAYTAMKDYGFIGVGSVIISGKVNEIGKKAFVGAGSVVTKSIEDNSSVAGVPARSIKR